MIGGAAPSEYLAKLESGNQSNPQIDPAVLGATELEE
jgi:hypothetical protein